MEAGQVEVVSYSPEQTQGIGRILGRRAQAGFVYLLSGELGAGKTCLTQGVLSGLDSEEHARSPSFILVTQYAGRLTLFHMDLYRIDDAQDVLDLGLDEYLYSDALSVVEWADKARGLLPDDALSIHIESIGETGRRLTLTAGSESYVPVLDAVASAVAASR